MKILVTGSAGFIGFHLVQRLIKRGDVVVGIDNINDYYDIRVKFGRLKKTGIEEQQIEWNKLLRSNTHENYSFAKIELQDRKALSDLFQTEKFDRVCHLAAQAGVRYSITNPYAYIESNISGFINILEACRQYSIKHLVYASSSSVYGLNQQMPFSTHDNVDHPVSLYAASKKSNELMAHSYSYLYQLPTTGLRFFTVYGPWGRPDMALFLFTKAIIEGKTIDIYNHGNMIRDFTYIDDIIEGVTRSIDNIPLPNSGWTGIKPDPATSIAPYKIYNIGNSSPVKLLDFISAIEDALGRKATKNYLPMQMGDIASTWADTKNLMDELGYAPKTDIKYGVQKFVEWYLEFFGGQDG
jgi:UDP-glucuronate 4-epimerase